MFASITTALQSIGTTLQSASMGPPALPPALLLSQLT